MPVFQKTYMPLFDHESRTTLIYACSHLSGVTTALTFSIITAPEYTQTVTNIPFSLIESMYATLGIKTFRKPAVMQVPQSNATITHIELPLPLCDLLVIDDAQYYKLEYLRNILEHAGQARTLIAYHPYTGNEDTVAWLESQPHTTATWKSNQQNLNPATMKSISENPDQPMWKGTRGNDTLTGLFPSLGETI